MKYAGERRKKGRQRRDTVSESVEIGWKRGQRDESDSKVFLKRAIRRARARARFAGASSASRDGRIKNTLTRGSLIAR